MVHKYLGLDKIVDKIIKKLGKVYLAFITGDYAIRKDREIIDLVLVGEIDQENLRRLVKKAEELIKRKLRTLLLSQSEYNK